MNKILISSDLLRPLVDSNGHIEYFHKARLDKYYFSLVYQISQAVNVPVEKFSYTNTDFDIFKFYSLCNTELRDVYSWLNIYDLQDIPNNAVEYYNKYIENSIVIYHEAPNIIKKIHNILNIPYIDLNVHPIRFLDDNFWGILTNNEHIFNRIKKHQIDERSFYIYANLIKSQVKSWYDSKIEPDSLLFTGQTNIDKSLYSNNKAMTIYDFEDKIKEFGEKYSKVYYKAHPYNDDLKNIYEFLEQFDFVNIIDENFYKLCSDENIKAVASITSGTLYEAKYFNKESIFLGKPYINLNYDKNCEYSEFTTLSIYNEFLTPQFWADILQDVLDVKPNIVPLVLPHRTNEIRTAFGDYWGQTELDPSVKINEKIVNNKIAHLNQDIYNNKKELLNKIEQLSHKIEQISYKIYDLYTILTTKARKIFYKENHGQKRIIHIGPLKIKYKKIAKNELFNYPHSLIIDTTILCNNNCSFCWRKNNTEYLKQIQNKYSQNHTMPFDVFKRIIDDAVQYDSLRWFSCSGPMGDPMMNPQISDFYEYVNKKRHFKDICVNTNGLSINKHNIEKLMNNITEFSISVDSINPNTYAKIHGNANFLPQVIENIKMLINYKNNNNCLAKIVVRFTENEINQGEFEEFKKFFLNLGVDEINYTQIHGFAGVHKNLKNQNAAKSCQQILGAINFNFMGDMTTCCVNWQINPTFGNIKNNTIKQMWNNKKMQDWLKNRLTTEPCKDCSGIGSDVQHSIKIQKEH